MIARYTPTPADYQHAAWLYYRSSRWAWLLLALFSGLFVLGAAALLRGPERLPGPALFSVMLLPLFAFYLLTTPRRLARDNLSNPTEITWEISAEQALINGKGSARFGWDALSRVLEDERCFLLFDSARGNRFHILPKRAFASAGDIQAFRALIGQQ